MQLTIKWLHLSVDGETCPRCSETGKELLKAVNTLKEFLSPLGFEVVFEEVELTPEDFSRDPFKSNEVWINGRLLEDWIGAKVTQTPCCDVCGDQECRALEVDQQLQEVVKADLVVKAALMAVAELKTSCCSETSCCD
ncbi:DUF2703 domain-containing protein [Archaeoglobus fulgidus]|jgi:hypothetical protein|uniref:Uncharacterized protein AF_1295 n=3 Tax=Archaeoglobus fulgidus TaxID=2234 RepID=Y1295_ARCFU|nr:DUF2703 domain-containing protein [Archaeoglobus fulgidus]O28974.1 RecName: Full=Uncharacterized protein AF_1295 [Archaeoglobus fulgidus DSM 4304]AAB89951.1 predicted coding region AF_1295 [Archaeoglobus fulgidus DSM 4304]AIG98175.1 hypothetical protein AFULGI_00014060 [Archaeoglobus fulgidus DSM 8774]KUJ93065.1 MAG: hypothetical protein XD40_1748 [Archaeoglobus fulgidus]KUK06184.1 MAG: Uncharacterized protein XD48_1566 [Archaeoglobus fulgidus]